MCGLEVNFESIYFILGADSDYVKFSQVNFNFKIRVNYGSVKKRPS